MPELKTDNFGAMSTTTEAPTYLENRSDAVQAAIPSVELNNTYYNSGDRATQQTTHAVSVGAYNTGDTLVLLLQTDTGNTNATSVPQLTGCTTWVLRQHGWTGGTPANSDRYYSSINVEIWTCSVTGANQTNQTLTVTISGAYVASAVVVVCSHAGTILPASPAIPPDRAASAATDYSGSSAYWTNTRVLYSGRLYRCLQDITGGEIGLHTPVQGGDSWWEDLSILYSRDVATITLSGAAQPQAQGLILGVAGFTPHVGSAETYTASNDATSLYSYQAADTRAGCMVFRGPLDASGAADRTLTVTSSAIPDAGANWNIVCIELRAQEVTSNPTVTDINGNSYTYGSSVIVSGTAPS